MVRPYTPEYPDPANRGSIDFRMGANGRPIVEIFVEIDKQIFHQTLYFLPNSNTETILKNMGGQFKVWAKQVKE